MVWTILSRLLRVITCQCYPALGMLGRSTKTWTHTRRNGYTSMHYSRYDFRVSLLIVGSYRRRSSGSIPTRRWRGT